MRVGVKRDRDHTVAIKTMLYSNPLGYAADKELMLPTSLRLWYIHDIVHNARIYAFSIDLLTKVVIIALQWLNCH